MSSEGVSQTLLDYLSARHHAYIESIHYICIFNSCWCAGNTMTSFDTDSSFWVCDNFATRLICNDKTLFIGDLVPSIYIVGAAMGTLEPTLMGTVQLRITDNNGKKHTLTLTHVNYVPNSPVNLLTTRVLSIKFTDENGIDTHGTGIHLCYEDHTLIWDHDKYCKIFKTHASGLPKCLFSSGYSCLETCTTMLASYYDDAVNWAFSTKAKDKDFANSEEGNMIVHVSYTEVTIDAPVTVENMTLFFRNIKLRYNDGNGTRDIVTFLGVDSIDRM
jgi:hypothetical protein